MLILLSTATRTVEEEKDWSTKFNVQNCKYILKYILKYIRSQNTNAKKARGIIYHAKRHDCKFDIKQAMSKWNELTKGIKNVTFGKNDTKRRATKLEAR